MSIDVQKVVHSWQCSWVYQVRFPFHLHFLPSENFHIKVKNCGFSCRRWPFAPMIQNVALYSGFLSVHILVIVQIEHQEGESQQEAYRNQGYQGRPSVLEKRAHFFKASMIALNAIRCTRSSGQAIETEWRQKVDCCGLWGWQWG